MGTVSAEPVDGVDACPGAPGPSPADDAAAPPFAVAFAGGAAPVVGAAAVASAAPLAGASASAAADATHRDLAAYPGGPEPAPRLAVVIALRDEGPNVAPLCEAIDSWLRDSPRPIEVIAVDDGSDDGTLVALRAQAAKRPWLRVATLGRPLGKSAALALGFSMASAPVLATLDGDLQDDPREIDCLLEVLDPRGAGRAGGLARSPEGADLVVGWRRIRRDGLLRRLQGRLWNALLRALTPLDLHDANCGLKVMWREVALAIPLTGEGHRLLPAVAALRGFRVRERAVLHQRRRFGASKVRFGRALTAAVDLASLVLLEGFADRPARAFGALAYRVGGAGVVAGIGAALAVYADLAPLAVGLAAAASGLVGGGIALFGLGLAVEAVLARLLAPAARGLPPATARPGGPVGPWAGSAAPTRAAAASPAPLAPSPAAFGPPPASFAPPDATSSAGAA